MSPIPVGTHGPGHGRGARNYAGIRALGNAGKAGAGSKVENWKTVTRSTLPVIFQCHPWVPPRWLSSCRGRQGHSSSVMDKCWDG